MRNKYFVYFFLLTGFLFFTYNNIILEYNLTPETCTIKKYNENMCEVLYSKKCITQIIDKLMCDKYLNNTIPCYVSRQKYFGFCKLYLSQLEANEESNKLIYLFS